VCLVHRFVVSHFTCFFSLFTVLISIYAQLQARMEEAETQLADMTARYKHATTRARELELELQNFQASHIEVTRLFHLINLEFNSRFHMCFKRRCESLRMLLSLRRKTRPAHCAGSIRRPSRRARKMYTLVCSASVSELQLCSLFWAVVHSRSLFLFLCLREGALASSFVH